MAGYAREKSLADSHPSRPPLHSQHSNSVPSTPAQKPRDLRFHSRSPSPGRGLNNNSPRSIVSDFVGPGSAAQQRSHTVCLFETGTEIRKRRIPYVEGGNEELRPPKKEPKKSLEPEEQEKLAGLMDDLYKKLLPSDESEERRARLVKKLERILNAEWPGNDIQVNVFGSSGNLLSSSDSDVDICITTPLKKLESMHSLAAMLHKNGMEKVVCRASAKVPIVKCWDPELNLAADLNVNNPLALENTRMIKTYVQLDERVRPLAKIIKYWTKRRILNDAAFGGTISSYTWICMIINFLQRRDPPILPSLQKIAEEQNQANPDGGQRQFADDIDALKGSGAANKETLPDLLFQFFRHYGFEFDYSKYVVSVREGRLLSRKEKGWDPSNYAEKEARNRLCVEEPFTVIRNLGNSADDYAWSGIHAEIRRAFSLLADGCQLEKCCEEYEFPPEEKHIFQRPTPKPKPTLTRSASQSGRPTQDSSASRSRKGANRNQSAQRSGNRRASSGAGFNNLRGPFPFQSPPLGASVADYFGIQPDLHNQLYQRWQTLQAQTDALKSQLAAQQMQQQQQYQQAVPPHGPGRPASDISGSPIPRSYSNGMPSPRFLDNPPPTAPLLPGYLWHYPARYPPPSPMSQARTREGGTSTNPSSPSLVAAVPALRRVHRGSVPDGSSSSIRSQSQPGRSLPHPLTLQQQVHPGYDVSGAMLAQYPSLRSSSGPYGPLPPGMQLPFTPTSMTGFPAAAPIGPIETAMPKEYVGYYVGQSPSLGPQYASTGQVPMPSMTLQNPPTQRQRRMTPDLMPPLPNGKHTSRSPSPLGHLRSYSTAGDLRSAHAQGLQMPSRKFDASMEPMPPLAPVPTMQAEPAAPLIVNGSGTIAPPSLPQQVNGISGSSHAANDTAESVQPCPGSTRSQSLPLRSNQEIVTTQSPVGTEQAAETSSRVPPSPRLNPGLKLKDPPNGIPTGGVNGTAEPLHESPHVAAPHLSPVAELRTPSPTRTPAFERDSPIANGLVKAAKAANARQAERSNGTDLPATSPPSATKHERKNSAPNPSSAVKSTATAKSPVTTSPVSSVPSAQAKKENSTSIPRIELGLNQNSNPWQQVSSARKGHKKSKSTANAGQATATASVWSGQALPVNEGERKGG